MIEKYVDKLANIHVLGYLMKEPDILEETDKYRINYNDFTDRLHKICFIAINNLYTDGLKKIENVDIYNYVKSSMPQDEKYFIDKDGQDFLNKILIISKKEKFEYYYSRMKKFSLLRTYIKYGMDIKDFYNPDEIDFEKKSRQEAWLNNCNIQDIIDLIDKKIESIKDNYKFEGSIKSKKLGETIFETLNTLEETPAFGLPLPFGVFNTLTAGARLSKVYLTSADTGVGKSRWMIGSAAYLSCGSYYSIEENEWINLTWKEPTIYISTELQEDELQTATLAFISGVDEGKILGKKPISFEEQKRLKKGAEIIQNAPLYMEYIPDFSIEDVERIIRINIKQNDVKYVFFDYIHTSMKLLAEITQATRGMKLREDNILFMLAVKLKELANKYGVFIQSGTQVNRSVNNGSATTAMLRGSSAIADKVDYGEIIMYLSEEDRQAYSKIKNSLGTKLPYEPNRIRNIYKNRGGEQGQGKLWCYADLGTCRFIPLFYTTNNYEVIDLPIFNIKVVNDNDK